MHSIKEDGGIFAGGAKARKKFVEETFVLKPGQGKSIALGSFAHGTPMPKFDVIYEPGTDMEMIGQKLDSIDDPEAKRSLLIYHFHNYDSKECSVTVRRNGEEPEMTI
ncbi:MAG TPA: hypothetical protein VIS56_01010 [Candidatus Saccharimonadales bacterium]